MSYSQTLKKVFSASSATLGLLAIQILPALASEYTFTVTNNTSAPIREVFVSEDGENWGYFDLGGTSIPPRGTVELEWNESTNNSGCDWWLQVTFSNGEESDAVEFDFCDNPEIVVN